MKKGIIVLITISLLLGILWSINRDQKPDKSVETFIKQEQNMVISLNYPKTNIKKLDGNIKHQVHQIYDDFIKEYSTITNNNDISELNIDYSYQFINDRYINIVLEEFVNENTLNHPKNKLYTYVFDIKKNKFLSLSDVIDQNDLKKITVQIQKQLLKEYPESINTKSLSGTITPEYKHFTHFTFDDENLILYFNPYELSSDYYHIIDIEIPLENINLKLDLELGTNIEKQPIVTKTTSQIIDPNKKMIAITFDDGPGRYTKDILKILKKYDAYATFFVLGNKVEIYDESTRAIMKQGSEIGNHSYNHKWLIKLKKDEFIDQINMTQDIIERTTGYRPKVLRPTYGDVNETMKKNTDLDIVLWNIDTLDWKIRNPKKIANRVIGKVEDGDIVLMHDTHKQTVEALKLILPKLKEEGFQFVTISELKEARTIKKYNVSK